MQSDDVIKIGKAILVRDTGSSKGKSPVIFIHGLNSESNVWDELLIWLNDPNRRSNVNYHGEHPTFYSNYDVWRFDYDSHDHVSLNGEALLQAVQQAGLTSPIIVAHSMGGIVARDYISKGGEISELVTIGTPHWGSGEAGWDVLHFEGGDGAKDIRWGSDYLKNLEANDRDRHYRRLGKYTLFAGEIVVNHLISYEHDYPKELRAASAALGGANDGCVPVKSALFCWDDDNKSCYCKGQKYHSDWDHFHLTAPDACQEVFAYILAGFQYPDNDWGNYWRQRAHVNIGSYAHF